MNAFIQFTLFFLLFFSVSVCAYSQSGNLTGIVLDETNRPMPGATLQLVPDTTGSDSIIKRSDENGFFSFSNLRSGAYTLTISFIGYGEQPISVSIQSKSAHLHIRLQPSVQQLGEVVVEADPVELRKREESLNIEVVNRDFIRRHLGGSLMKTLERLPGIQTIGIGSGQSKPLIRGLGFNRVVVADKGIKHEGQQWGADHGLEIDQFAAGEIELIKGAASFMYGSDAIGGVIDIKPLPVPSTNSLSGSVDLLAKSNNAHLGSSVNLMGRKEQWFFDSRLTYQRYSDYRVPTDRVYVYDYEVRLHNHQLRNTAGEETGLHFSTGYITERFRSTFHLSNVYSNSGFFANAHGLEPRRVDTDLHDRSPRDIQMPSQKVNHFKLINRSEYALATHRLELEAGYQHNFRQEFSQYVNHGYMPAIYPEEMYVPANLERQFDKKVYSVNLRDNIVAGKHLLTAGINSEHQHNSINGWSFLVPSFSQTTAGAFIYDKWKLTEHILLHGAIRYDYGRIQIDPYTDWFDSQRNTSEGIVSEKLLRADNLTRRFNSFVWSAGLNYNWGKLELKTNLGKSFRMPIAKELAANGVNYHYFSFERGNAGLSPEQSYQADLSLSWKANRWSVQLSPYYNYFPNYIYLNPTPTHDYFYGAGNQVFAYTQSRVRRYGAEIAIKAQLLKNVQAELLGEYLDARQLSGDKKGFPLPFSPPASALFNLTFSPGINPHLQNSYFSVDYRLTARQNNIVPPEKKTPGYGIINLQAGTKLLVYHHPISINLQVQNLLNTRYLNHTSFYRLIELPEAGRNIIFSLKIPFTIKSNE